MEKEIKEVKMEVEEPWMDIQEVPVPESEDVYDEELNPEDFGQPSITALIDELEAEKTEFKNKYLLALADFDNYKKRMQNIYPTYERSGMVKVLTGMFQIVDDLERAIKMNESNEDIESLKNGFELIYKKFMTTFETLGVKKIETEDTVFNTDYHEAVTLFPGSEEQKNMVVECMQTGYTLDDKVIRHSKVVVGQ